MKLLSRVLALVVCCLAGVSSAQTTRVASYADVATASEWYAGVFGAAPAGEKLVALYRAHLLVEEYFAEPSAERREAIPGEIEKLGVGAREVAELAGIRLGWKAVEPGVYYINDRLGPSPVKYFVGVPKGYEAGKARWPVVVVLPTATKFAVRKDVTPDQVAEVYTGWIRDELGKREGCIVVMPLLHLTDLWGPGYAGMNNVMKPLQDVCERFSVDVRRVYLRGQGMSAHAVWNLGLHHPTYFAAVNPLAGSASYDWQRMRVIGLKNTLPVVWHDADDTSVPVKGSRELVALLRKNKVDVVYEETKGVGHVPGPDIDKRLWEKMSARVRNLNPGSVSVRTNRPDVAFSRVDWVQVWQAMDAGQDVRHIFRWSGTGMWTYQNPVTVEAKIATGNRIEIEARNLGSARLLLSGDMVDFSRAVSVRVNGRAVVEQMVKESVELTLQDQQLLGRGWRKYTAALEVDLIPPTSRPSTRASAGPSSRP
jgi:hypothetical protein